MELSLNNFFLYSVIWLPLIILVSWGLFKGIYPGNQSTRPLIVVISCVVVVAGFVSLQIVGRGIGFVLQEWDIYEAIYGVIAAAIGLLFWGKRIRTPPPTST